MPVPCSKCGTYPGLEQKYCIECGNQLLLEVGIIMNNTLNILGKEYDIDEIKRKYKKSLLGNIYKINEVYKPDPLKRNLSDVNKEITSELLNRIVPNHYGPSLLDSSVGPYLNLFKLYMNGKYRDKSEKREGNK